MLLMARGTILQHGDSLIAQPGIEQRCLKAERFEIHERTGALTGEVFGSVHEGGPIALLPQDGSDPQSSNVHTARPDIPQEPSQYFVMVILQEEADRVVLCGTGRGDVMDIEPLAHDIFERLWGLRLDDQTNVHATADIRAGYGTQASTPLRRRDGQIRRLGPGRQQPRPP